jgi:hypothetical protein
VIFSRNRGSGRHAKGDEARADARHSARRRERDEFGADPDEASLAEIDERDAAAGPYDITEAPDGIAQLDLGALRIPAVDGVEVRVQADNDGRIQQVVLVNGESALQLGVFAAPRSDGIWDEVRAEIRKQFFTDGVAAEEVNGDYGPELRARVRTPEGLTDIRFVGVDGPRWLVRAVYQGPAAVDPTVAPALVQCLEQLVVDRGHEAMPVREPLPLRLPREISDQGRPADGDSDDDPAAEAGEGAGAKPARRKPSPRPRHR